MAARRVDSKIGDDRTAGVSPIRSESRSSGGSSSCDERSRIGNEDLSRYRCNGNDAAGTIDSMGHDRLRKNETLVGEDEACKSKKTKEFADQRETLEREINDPENPRQSCEFRSYDRKRSNVVDLRGDNPIQIKRQRSTESKNNARNNETSISSRVIYKLVNFGEHRGSRDTVVKTDEREDSSRSQPCRVNPIVHRADDSTEGSGTSQTEVPRKLADSLKDCTTGVAVKRRDDVTDETVRSSTSQECPSRVGEPRSPNDSAHLRKARRHIGQAKCENCDEKARVSYDRHPYLHKCSGCLGCETGVDESCAKEGRGTGAREETPVASLLYHSRYLPRLSVHDSGVACSGNEQSPVATQPHNAADLKQLHTLKQHYYPEGDWGWIVLLVGMLVQVLSHGIHGSNGVFLQQVARKFGHHAYLESAYEDSGVATSGELGEHSFSEEFEGVVCLQNSGLKGIEEDENRDPRYIARCTIRQHYYPESGWGWVVVVTGVMVQILATGIHGAVGAWLLLEATKRYHQPLFNVGWLGAMSTGVALLVSPVTIAFCRRKSTRLTAVLGGLVTALGCLFTSFASQFHQLFFSYGTVVGIGVGMTRDCSTLMVAQYFKRRRELVEIFIVSGSGLGIAVMSAFIKGMISKIGWRLGLQAVTGVVFLTFILGTFYRSASLYHPQRRAILHLKNQKRKIKDKNKTDDRPPFFDFSTLKSKTVRILLVSTGISAFGINTPIFYLAHQAEEEGLGDTVVLLQAYLGLAWTLGCVAFGLLVVHRSVECRIARQYLTQAAVFVCGLCILALTAVQGNYHGYVMFAWIYGIFCGGYHYSLKMYTYERVRARNFAKTWGFVQCSQAIPIAIGVPISGYMNVGCGGKAGYYFSSTCVLVGSFTLFFIDLHRRNLSRHKHTRSNGTKHLCVSDNCPQRRKLSFSQEPENDAPHVAAASAATAALVLGAEIAPTPGEMIDALAPEKPELTCISEEGIADMDLPDNVLEDLDYIGDCITSCNKVENYLMLSEFENNLIAEMPIITDRRGRRWSIARSKGGQSNVERPTGLPSNEETDSKPKWHVTNVPPNNRVITVIDEASA